MAVSYCLTLVCSTFCRCSWHISQRIGGPGGSGVSFFSRYGNAFQTILDSNRAPNDMLSGALQERYFDVLTWDPRGVNNTTPRHSCIPNPVAKQTWDAEGAAIGFDLQEKGVFSNVWSRGITWGKACADTDEMTALNRVNEDEHLGQYVSTANVVRDMVEIIERHGEWRENRVRKLIGTSRLRENKDDILHRTIWRKGEEQLQYWGFSYGTVLGQTFASMQPHRVGRMVLDGVVNAEDYMLNGWSKNLNDIDKITELFARTCVEVGPRRCSFYFPGEDGMILKLSDIMNTLKANPIPAIYKGVLATVTHSDLVLLIFDTWYRPLFGFRSIADRLTELSNRNGSFFAAMKYQAESETCSFSSSSQSDTASAAMAIACTDGESPNSKTQDEWRAYINLLQGQSSMFANRWAQLPLPCTGYSSVRANWRFTGPFGAHTANPIMFISETLDPVTPFRNAVNAAELFPGSVVLETEGAGHCTISMPSIEGMLAVRKYFEAGEVPANGTKYKAAMGYFEDEPMLGNLSSRPARDREMMEAAMMIAQTWPRYA
jgi:pimeloyl-ACP methyl ester carboxylesterase